MNDLQLETDQYLTVSKSSEAVYREKMSKFLAFVTETKSVAEARNFMEKIASEYHDARHVCWAYMIGPDRKTFLSSDNGEPSGTAGKPMLGQINSFNITDVTVVTVRYFGGIKLGTSGLINAYRTAARMAIEEAGTVVRNITENMTLTFSYMVMNDVMKVIKKFQEVKFLRQEFDNSCTLEINVRRRDAEAISRALKDVDSVVVSF